MFSMCSIGTPQEMTPFLMETPKFKGYRAYTPKYSSIGNVGYHYVATL